MGHEEQPLPESGQRREATLGAILMVHSHDNMTPEAWVNYPDRVRSTHWWELFPVGDGRRSLTWKGRFANVTDIVNFYSSEDEVVCNGDGMPKDIDREFAWYNQETRKGLWPFMLHEYEGGWAFNAYYDVPTYTWIGDQQVEGSRHLTPEEAEALNDGQLRRYPFFLDFANPEMCASTNGALVASNYLYRAEMLAYAIPSESYAVGANLLQAIACSTNANSGLISQEGNFDMGFLFHDDADYLSGEDAQKWKHSTFVQRPYKRTQQLYKAIIGFTKGGSNQ